MSVSSGAPPKVILHQAALDMISDWAGDEGGETGILLGPDEDTDGTITALDASPLSEISGTRTWTSEAVAQAREFTRKWHPRKRIVGWYRVVDGRPVWDGAYGRTAELFGDTSPLLVIAAPGDSIHGVCLPGWAGRRRGTKLIAHTLISADGRSATVEPPAEPKPEPPPPTPPVVEDALVLPMEALAGPASEGPLVFSEEGVVEHAAGPAIVGPQAPVTYGPTPTPTPKPIAPPHSPRPIPVQAPLQAVDAEEARRELLIARAQAARQGRRLRVVALVAVAGMVIMGVVAAVLAQQKKRAADEASRAQAASMASGWGPMTYVPSAPAMPDPQFGTPHPSGQTLSLHPDTSLMPTSPGRSGEPGMGASSRASRYGTEMTGSDYDMGSTGSMESLFATGEPERPAQAGRLGAPMPSGSIGRTAGTGRASTPRGM